MENLKANIKSMNDASLDFIKQFENFQINNIATKDLCMNLRTIVNMIQKFINSDSLNFYSSNLECFPQFNPIYKVEVPNNIPGYSNKNPPMILELKPNYNSIQYKNDLSNKCIVKRYFNNCTICKNQLSPDLGKLINHFRYKHSMCSKKYQNFETYCYKGKAFSYYCLICNIQIQNIFNHSKSSSHRSSISFMYKNISNICNNINIRKVENTIPEDVLYNEEGTESSICTLCNDTDSEADNDDDTEEYDDNDEESQYSDDTEEYDDNYDEYSDDYSSDGSDETSQFADYFNLIDHFERIHGFSCNEYNISDYVINDDIIYRCELCKCDIGKKWKLVSHVNSPKHLSRLVKKLKHMNSYDFNTFITNKNFSYQVCKRSDIIKLFEDAVKRLESEFLYINNRKFLIK